MQYFGVTLIMSVALMREAIRVGIYACYSIGCVNFRVLRYSFLFYFHLSQYGVHYKDAVSNFHSASPLRCPQQVISFDYTAETPNEQHESVQGGGCSLKVN